MRRSSSLGCDLLHNLWVNASSVSVPPIAGIAGVVTVSALPLASTVTTDVVAITLTSRGSI